MLKKLSLGVIGPGNHFKKNIFPTIKKCKFIKIKSFLSSKKFFLNKFTYKNESEFFKNDYDFVYISTPNVTHEKYIIKSLNNNYNVICEKPFLTRKKNLNKILNLSKKKKKLIIESFMYMYHPVFKEIEKSIKSKKYGKLNYLISNFKFAFLNKNNNRYRKDKGNGFWFDAACYLISFDNYFFGIKKKIKKINIKDKVELRGAMTLESNNIKRYYFWGEGQEYKNDLELFFSKATIFVNQFYAKRHDDKIKLKIFKNRKIFEKVFAKKNHFELMFKDILKNYKKIEYQNFHRKIIYDQSKFLI